MRGVVAVASALLVSLASAGCFVSDDDPQTQGGEDGAGTTSDPATGNPGAGVGANRAPTANLTAGTLNGSAQLTVNFTLEGSDPDGDALVWTLTFGDNSTGLNGTTLPANATHTFPSSGAFAVVFTVTDPGNLSANSTLSLNVTGGGPVPEAQHFEDTVTGGPYVPQVGAPNQFWPGATVTHEFTTTTAAKTMTITLAYEDGAFFTDLDVFVTGPGVETSSEASGHEPPLVIQDPQAGDWSIDVFAYGAEVSTDYTLDVTFS